VTGQRQVRGKPILQGAIRVRGKADRSQKVPELAHFIGRKRCGRSQDVREVLVERFNKWPIPTPMKRLVPQDILQRLGHHDALHRVMQRGLKGSQQIDGRL